MADNIDAKIDRAIKKALVEYWAYFNTALEYPEDVKFEKEAKERIRKPIKDLLEEE